MTYFNGAVYNYDHNGCASHGHIVVSLRGDVQAFCGNHGVFRGIHVISHEAFRSVHVRLSCAHRDGSLVCAHDDNLAYVPHNDVLNSILWVIANIYRTRATLKKIERLI